MVIGRTLRSIHNWNSERIPMRWLIMIVVAATLVVPARAENPKPYSGTQVIETGKTFATFVDDLRGAIPFPSSGNDAGAKIATPLYDKTWEIS